jgi:carboxyl-terminal processing protease
MQQTTEFDKNGAVVLTVAKYKTTVSEYYDGVGLVPDYTVENTFDAYDEQKNRAVDAAMSLLGQ